MKYQLLLIMGLLWMSSLVFFTAGAQRNNSYKNVEDMLVGYSLGAHLGTQGFGLNAAYATSEVFALRLEGSIAPLGFSKIRSWDNNKYNMDMKGRFYNGSLKVEVKPFRRASNSLLMQKLAVIGGAAYFFKAETDATALLKGDYHYGDIVIPNSDVGKFKANIKWKPWAPYMGVGIRNLYLGSLFKGGYLGLNIDIGSYYMSTPDVQVTADKLLSENTSNEGIIERNMRSYRWLPVVQVGISYGFFNY
ncbi:ornithine uptake porin CarO type 1 [Arachidicoccus ginsenosidivorans]